MNDLKRDVKAAVAEQFGRTADAYRTSSVHASGADLARLVELLAPGAHDLLLDAGCGAGHTAAALAPHAGRVVALDLSPQMLANVERLASERALTNITVQQGDVEAIDAADGQFDHVASRYSAHHWPNPQRALREIRRVVRTGGRFVLSDIVSFDAPVVDTHLQAIELLRDGSHVRDHSVAQWQQMFTEAGFRVTAVERFDCPLEFAAWVERMATPPERVAMLRSLFAAAPAEVREALAVAPADGADLQSFVLPGALFVAIAEGEPGGG